MKTKYLYLVIAILVRRGLWLKLFLVEVVARRAAKTRRMDFREERREIREELRVDREELAIDPLLNRVENKGFIQSHRNLVTVQ